MHAPLSLVLLGAIASAAAVDTAVAARVAARANAAVVQEDPRSINANAMWQLSARKGGPRGVYVAPFAAIVAFAALRFLIIACFTTVNNNNNSTRKLSGSGNEKSMNCGDGNAKEKQSESEADDSGEEERETTIKQSETLEERATSAAAEAAVSDASEGVEQRSKRKRAAQEELEDEAEREMQDEIMRQKKREYRRLKKAVWRARKKGEVVTDEEMKERLRQKDIIKAQRKKSNTLEKSSTPAAAAETAASDASAYVEQQSKGKRDEAQVFDAELKTELQYKIEKQKKKEYVRARLAVWRAKRKWDKVVYVEMREKLRLKDAAAAEAAKEQKRRQNLINVLQKVKRTEKEDDINIEQSVEQRSKRKSAAEEELEDELEREMLEILRQKRAYRRLKKAVWRARKKGEVVTDEEMKERLRQKDIIKAQRNKSKTLEEPSTSAAAAEATASDASAGVEQRSKGNRAAQGELKGEPEREMRDEIMRQEKTASRRLRKAVWKARQKGEVVTDEEMKERLRQKDIIDAQRKKGKTLEESSTSAAAAGTAASDASAYVEQRSKGKGDEEQVFDAELKTEIQYARLAVWRAKQKWENVVYVEMREKLRLKDAAAAEAAKEQERRQNLMNVLQRVKRTQKEDDINIEKLRQRELKRLSFLWGERKKEKQKEGTSEKQKEIPTLETQTRGAVQGQQQEQQIQQQSQQTQQQQQLQEQPQIQERQQEQHQQTQEQHQQTQWQQQQVEEHRENDV